MTFEKIVDLWTPSSLVTVSLMRLICTSVLYSCLVNVTLGLLMLLGSSLSLWTSCVNGSEGFGPSVPEDDIIAFALSAKFAGVPMHVCNEEKFGYIMTPLEDGDELEDDHARLSDLRLQMIADRGPVPIRYFASFNTRNLLWFTSKLGFRFGLSD